MSCCRLYRDGAARTVADRMCAVARYFFKIRSWRQFYSPRSKTVILHTPTLMGFQTFITFFPLWYFDETCGKKQKNIWLLEKKKTDLSLCSTEDKFFEHVYIFPWNPVKIILIGLNINWIKRIGWRYPQLYMCVYITLKSEYPHHLVKITQVKMGKAQ